jgi:hypothetical protein
MFNFDTYCLLCAGSVKGCKRRDISIVSHQSTVTLITNLCGGTCDSAAVAVKDRMLGCDLVELNARYHKKCYKAFVYRFEHPTNFSAGVLASHPLPLEVIDSTNSISHAHMLARFCELNGLHITQTAGGGDCFYHAVQLGCAALGLTHSIRDVREITADQLQLHSALYKPLYRLDGDGQSVSYELFVHNTRTSNEWCTQLSIAACVRGLQRVIRLVSTGTGPDGKASVYVNDYSDGVAFPVPDIVVVVGYNQQEAHYLGLGVMSRNISHLSTPNGSIITVNAVVDAVNAPPGTSSTDVDVDMVDIDNQLADHFAMNCVADDAVTFLDNSVGRVVNISDVETTFCEGASNVDVDMPTVSNGFDNEVDSVAYSREQCECCKRQSTVTCNIYVTVHEGKIICRQFGFLKSRPNSVLLCRCCFMYTTSSVKSPSLLWAYGWPAAITSLLHRKSYAHIRNDLWQRLPARYKDCWANFASTIGLTCEQREPKAFADFTIHLQRYKTLTTCGNISDFVLSNDDFAFPCVRLQQVALRMQTSVAAYSLTTF